jgi:hypothetical protein
VVGRLLVIGVAVLAPLAVPVSAPAASVRWYDSVGDHDAGGGAALDIGSVVVSWDDAGNVGASVEPAGPHRLGAGDRITVLIDSDANDATGGAGADHAIFYEKYGSGDAAFLRAWGGSGFDVAVPQSTLAWHGQSDRVSVQLHRSELGWPSAGIRVWVVSPTPDAPVRDRAPDAGAYLLAPLPAALPSPSPGPAPAPTPGPAPAPVAAHGLTAAEARAAVRRLVRRRLGARARVARLRCAASGVSTAACALRVRRGAYRWRGAVKVVEGPRGRRRAAFNGSRVKVRCRRDCRRRVRWAR